jgi:hypothetical protein
MIYKPANLLICVAAVLLSIGSFASASTTNPPGHPATPKKTVAYGKLPLQFEVNQGHADARVKMLARGQGYNILLQPTAAMFELNKTAKGHETSHEVVRMAFSGASQSATLSAEQQLPGYVNYLNGPDRSKWQTGVNTYARVRATGIYPGVDVVYYGTDRQMEFDMVVAPGAKTDAIHMLLTGAMPVLDVDGELVLTADRIVRSDDVRLRKPVLYQMNGSKHEPVEGSFTLAANGEVGFRVGAYDHTRELVIDPILSYASYFGGSSYDYINATAVNAANQLYAVGQTKSVDLPTTAGGFQATNIGSISNNNNNGGFVTKFSADGSSVLWTTYLGGNGDSVASGVAVDSSDQAYIVGYTNACGSNGTSYQTTGEFPFTADAVQPLCNPQVIGFNNFETNGGNYDAFLVKLSADGKSELYGTPLGGTANDFASGVALDAAGQVYIVGETSSTEYYVPGPGSRDSQIPNYPVGPASYYLPANVGTANYPTTKSAFYTNTTESELNSSKASDGGVTGPQDEQAFVTVLSADLKTIAYSSLLGGTGLGGCGNGVCGTNGIAVAVSAKNIAFIGGNTASAHWPVTASAFGKTCTNAGAANSECNLTGWLAAFDATKSGTASLLFTTYVDGLTAGKSAGGASLNPTSDVFGLATDSTGNVVMTGDTSATDFPTTSGTLQPSCFKFGDGNGDTNVCAFEGFLAKVSSAGSIIWSSYVGPTKQDGAAVNGKGVALDASNNVYLLASANSPNLPLKNAIVSTPTGTDAYLAEIASDGSTALMGTYLGAGGGITLNDNDLQLDAQLNAYFGGSQGVNPYGGTSLPVTANAFQKTLLGNTAGFAVKIITQQQPSATALVVSPSGSAAPSQTITLTATVTTTSTVAGKLLPTGTVTFLNGSTTIGTGTLSTNGVATYSGTLTGGAYTITASYAGDAAFNASVSSASTLTISSAGTTTTTLTVAPASSAYGSGATLTATVLAGKTPAPSAAVIFMAGTAILGTANTNAQGVASITVKPVVGMYSVVATYAGTYNQTSNPTGYGASVSAGVMLTVTKAASNITLESSTSTAGIGSSFTLTGTVPAGATGTVSFYNGTVLLGTGMVGSGGTATLTSSIGTAGTYSLSAVYTGDTDYNGSTSSSAVQIVIAVPSITVAASPTSLTISRGSTGTTTLTITPQGGYAGTLTFTCGTLPSLATCTFNPATVKVGTAAVTTTLTIGTGTASASSVEPKLFDTHGAIYAGLFLGLLGFTRRKKLTESARLLVAVVCIVGLGALTGCGGSNAPNTTNETPAGSYTINVTGTGTTGSPQTVSLAVVVQ